MVLSRAIKKSTLIKTLKRNCVKNTEILGNLSSSSYFTVAHCTCLK